MTERDAEFRGSEWDQPKEPARVSLLRDALEMVRDADEDCHKDGLPAMPAIARKQIEDALQTLAATLEWQPIEKAPKDKAILVYNLGYNIAHYNTAFGYWVGGDDSSSRSMKQFPPTHWMPLPAHPEDSK